ncbi:glycosyltransferase family 2 protein [Butyrivibrio proteoclasticus]|uniref:glycosyltransferase family 2 protein n=1 Tax=Butyrivibrio proteoclasticus TaxID=43305 RepID=UPI00047E3A46|nr:glycosyltransferase family 2 protein [Butyrivibrio proteoclasticus]
MLKNELISVVVPIYNAENYIKRCVDSILAQTYENLEVILVDDGSTDSTPSILDEYADKDKRVRVIHKENAGHAHSRNQGLLASSGEFITFMDCDDYMHPDYMSKMYGAVCEDGSDMACCSFNYVDESGTRLGWSEPSLVRCYVNSLTAQKKFLTSYDIEGFSWNKLVRRSILIDNNLRYPEDQKAFVDMFLWYRAISACDKVSFVADKLYDYYQMSGSVVHTIDDIKMGNFRTTLSNIRNAAHENGLVAEGDYYVSLRMMNQVYDQIKTDIKSRFKSGFYHKYSWDELFILDKKDTSEAIYRFDAGVKLQNRMKAMLIGSYLK